MLERDVPKRNNIRQHFGDITHEQRCDLFGTRNPKTFWITGLSGSGKSTIAYAIEKHLHTIGQPCYVLDGDNVRHDLNKDLGFSSNDRIEHIRRVSEVAKLFNDAGITVIAAFISPLIIHRQNARTTIGDDRFVEIYISTNLEICKNRDTKGLYKKAILGQIKSVPGIDMEYQEPEYPDLIFDTSQLELFQIMQQFEDHYQKIMA